MSDTTTPPVLDPQQQQQPPPLVMAQQAYTAHTGRGSVGPVIGVLAVIFVLGAIAVMIGRLCSGRRIMGRGQYDFEGWVETKCASCIDGRIDPPPRRVVEEHSVSSSPRDAAAAPPPEETPEGGKEVDEVPEQQQHNHISHNENQNRAES